MKKILVLAAGSGLGAAIALLYWVPPGPGSFYPSCLFHQLTGWYCPGCGSTRCLHALVTGDFQQAVAFNPLLVLVFPFLTMWGLRLGYSAWTGRTVKMARLPAWSVYLLVLVIISFWILRNIPHAPFSQLSPHPI